MFFVIFYKIKKNVLYLSSFDYINENRLPLEIVSAILGVRTNSYPFIAATFAATGCPNSDVNFAFWNFEGDNREEQIGKFLFDRCEAVRNQTATYGRLFFSLLVFPPLKTD